MRGHRRTATDEHQHDWTPLSGTDVFTHEFACACGQKTFACESCGEPMARNPASDQPIPAEDGLFEAYRCARGHVYFEPVD
jgi:hypothetical protein